MNIFCLILVNSVVSYHYEPVEYFGGETRFAVQQINDDYKRVYADKMGVYLLEVSYTVNRDEDIIQLVSRTLDDVIHNT